MFQSYRFKHRALLLATFYLLPIRTSWGNLSFLAYRKRWSGQKEEMTKSLPTGKFKALASWVSHPPSGSRRRRGQASELCINTDLEQRLCPPGRTRSTEHPRWMLTSRAGPSSSCKGYIREGRQRGWSVEYSLWRLMRRESLLSHKKQVSEYLLSTFCVLSLMPGLPRWC